MLFSGEATEVKGFNLPTCLQNRVKFLGNLPQIHSAASCQNASKYLDLNVIFKKQENVAEPSVKPVRHM